MANKIKFSANAPVALIAAGELANAAVITVQSAGINDTGKDVWADFQLGFTPAAAPTVDGVFTLWANPRILGAASANNEILGTPIGAFPVTVDNAAQVCPTLRGVRLSPAVYDFTLRNSCGQNATDVNLSVMTYNEEIQ